LELWFLFNEHAIVAPSGYHEDQALMLDEQPFLASYPNCPVCGGSERRRSDLEHREPGFYVRALATQIGIDSKDLLTLMTLHACERCDTVWFDPWFTPEAISSAYGYVAGRHRHGWSILDDWASGTPRADLDLLPRIWKLLHLAMPKISSYAEINCPFSGLLTHLHELRNLDVKRISIAGKIVQLGEMYRTSELKPEYAAKRRFADVTGVTPPWAGGDTDRHPWRYLINEPSGMCWDHSCIHHGASCKALAQDVFFDTITTFEALRDQNTRLSAIGLFSTLDHFQAPMRVLDKAIESADLVFAELHPVERPDSQHLYGFGDGLPALLIDRGISALDVTAWLTNDGRLGENRRYLLCSGVMELPNKLAGMSLD
jgi:hypothetical protein